MDASNSSQLAPGPTASSSLTARRTQDGDPQPRGWVRDYGFGPGDRRVSFSRQQSYRQLDQLPTLGRSDSFGPFLARNSSTISVPPDLFPLLDEESGVTGLEKGGKEIGLLDIVPLVFRAVRSGNRPMKRLALMISLNAAYSTTELLIGILTGRIGLLSDAFHLTFGCGLLTFSLMVMAVSQKKPDGVYTYGYKRLEVLSAFTNALFLLFMSFSLAVEALHAFIQDESEHKHYLIISAVTNLLVNLLGVWFFRNYARVNITYRKAEDMNYHSVCLHVLADSIRSAGIILASWFLTLGVENAEVLCLGLVSATVFLLVLPLFKASGSILLQMAPSTVNPSAFSKCWRQIASLDDVSEVSQARFWELVPGHVVGSVSIQANEGADEYSILRYVHGIYQDLGIQELTVQITHDSSS